MPMVAQSPPVDRNTCGDCTHEQVCRVLEHYNEACKRAADLYGFPFAEAFDIRIGCRYFNPGNKQDPRIRG